MYRPFSRLACNSAQQLCSAHLQESTPSLTIQMESKPLPKWPQPHPGYAQAHLLPLFPGHPKGRLSLTPGLHQLLNLHAVPLSDPPILQAKYQIHSQLLTILKAHLEAALPVLSQGVLTCPLLVPTFIKPLPRLLFSLQYPVSSFQLPHLKMQLIVLTSNVQSFLQLGLEI